MKVEAKDLGKNEIGAVVMYDHLLSFVSLAGIVADDALLKDMIETRLLPGDTEHTRKFIQAALEWLKEETK